MTVKNTDQRRAGTQLSEQRFDMRQCACFTSALAQPGRLPITMQTVGRGHGKETGAGDVFQ